MRANQVKKNVFILFCAFILYLYMDFIAFTEYAKIINILVFLFLIVLTIVKTEFAILTMLMLGILIREYPRDILNLFFDIQISEEVFYYTITSQKIGPLTLFQALVLFQVFFVLLIHLKISKEKVKYLFFIFLYSLIASIGFFFTFLDGKNTIQYSSVITDAKFPLFITCGFVLGSYLKSKKCQDNFINSIIAIIVIAGYRAFFFILSDIVLGTPKLDYVPLSYYALALIITYIFNNEIQIFKKPFFLIGLFLNFINTSRSFYLFFALSFVVIFLVKYKKKIYYKFIRIFITILIFVIIIIGIFLPSFYNFILWKLNVFKEFSGQVELSGSGKVRILELGNIFYDSIEKWHWFLFGKGFGGTYKYDHYSLGLIGEELGLDSYSIDQLESNVYYTVHNFLNYNILKVGFLGLIIYLFIPISIYRNIKKRDFFFVKSFILIGMIYAYYWRPELMILMGIFSTLF